MAERTSSGQAIRILPIVGTERYTTSDVMALQKRPGSDYPHHDGTASHSPESLLGDLRPRPCEAL